MKILNLTNAVHEDFDKILMCEWNKAMHRGAFNFKITEPLPAKILPGKFQLFIQVNPSRYTQKRQTELRLTDLNEPFNSNHFNFTKINKQTETLVQLARPPATKEDIIIINNSPIDFGSSLIVPDVNSLNNQVLTEYGINLAVEVALLSTSTNFLIGFNSLKSYASVNHLHFHLVYSDNKHLRGSDIPFTFPIQNFLCAEKISKHLWFIGDYFSPGFAFQISDFNESIGDFSSSVFKVCHYMAVNNIPHTLAIFKSYQFDDMLKTTVKAVVWPRKAREEIEANEMNVLFALCELSGHFLMPNLDDYNRISEDYILKVVELGAVPKEQMNKIKNDVSCLMI